MSPMIYEKSHESHHSHLSENVVAETPGDLSDLDDTQHGINRAVRAVNIHKLIN